MKLRDLLDKYNQDIEYTVESTFCDWNTIRHYRFSQCIDDMRNAQCFCINKTCNCCIYVCCDLPCYDHCGDCCEKCCDSCEESPNKNDECCICCDWCCNSDFCGNITDKICKCCCEDPIDCCCNCHCPWGK